MLTLSRKLFYAAEAVLHIAYAGSADPVSSKEIATRQGVAPRYLEQMMQKLVRAGILRGIRGPRGGYLLARDRRRITLADIAQALRDDGDERLPASTPLGDRILAPHWKRITGEAASGLKNVTIADLCDEAAAKSLRKPGPQRQDFAI